MRLGEAEVSPQLRIAREWIGRGDKSVSLDRRAVALLLEKVDMWHCALGRSTDWWPEEPWMEKEGTESCLHMCSGWRWSLVGLWGVLPTGCEAESPADAALTFPRAPLSHAVEWRLFRELEERRRDS